MLAWPYCIAPRNGEMRGVTFARTVRGGAKSRRSRSLQDSSEGCRARKQHRLERERLLYRLAGLARRKLLRIYGSRVSVADQALDPSSLVISSATDAPRVASNGSGLPARPIPLFRMRVRRDLGFRLLGMMPPTDAAQGLLERAITQGSARAACSRLPPPAADAAPRSASRTPVRRRA
jgi:hypothetical protein